MENATAIKEICPTTTQEWIKRGALLVDVREKNEVEQLAFGVHNIVNIPLSEFEERYLELSKEQEMVIVCRSGVKSLRATNFLLKHGFDPERVVNMQYGMDRWVKKGFPVKGEVSSIPGNTDQSCCSKPGCC